MRYISKYLKNIIATAIIGLFFISNNNYAQNSNVTLLGRWAFGPCSAVDASGDTVYFGNGSYLEIVDFTNMANPVELGKIILPSMVVGVSVSGNYAYVANGDGGLRIIDISNPASLTETGFFEMVNYALGVVVSGDYAYVANANDGLRIINISNPVSPFEAGFFDTGGSARDVVVNGIYAYVADGNAGLRIIDVSNPTNPTEAGFFDTGGYAYGVAVSGNYAYMADNQNGLRIIDISNPASPTETGFFDTNSYAHGVAISGNYAYIADLYDGLRVINISNPAIPTEVGYILTGGNAINVVVSNNYAYIADAYDGLRIINISNPANPTESGFFDTRDSAYGVTVSGNYAYIADGYDGLRIIDISNPTNPAETGFLNTNNWAYGVTLEGNYAYVAYWYYGMKIIDISNPANPTEVGFFDTGGDAYSIAVSGNYAYVADYWSGLRIINISNPTNPTETGFFVTQSYALDVAISGNYAYVADCVDGLRIIDISNSLNPVEAGFFDTGGLAYGIAISGNYAYVADWTDGLRIIDISNPANPIEAGFFDTGGVATSVDIRGNYAYVADGDDGFRIIDISNPSIPIELGYFNTGGFAYNIAAIGNNAYVADGGTGLYILQNDLIVANLPPVVLCNLNQTELIWGDSVLADASASYDPDNDSLDFEWTGNAVINTFDNDRKAWIKPWNIGETAINLDVSDGILHSDTTKFLLGHPKLNNINIEYSFVDSNWSFIVYYMHGDTLMVPLVSKDTTKIYDITVNGINPIVDIVIPNALRIYSLRNNTLYVGLEGTTGGFWGQGPLSIYSVGSQWQLTPLLENYLPGISDVSGLSFLDDNTAITYDRTSVYKLDFSIPSNPQILAQADYGFPKRLSNPQIVGDYIYIGVNEWPVYTIEILNKSTLSYLTTLNISPEMRNFTVHDTLIFVGFLDSLSIYSVSNPLQASHITTLTVPFPNGWIHPNSGNYYGSYVENNLLTVEKWASIVIFDISNPAIPQIFASWYGGYGFGGRNGMGLNFSNGEYYIFNDFGASPLTSNIYSGINRISFGSTSIDGSNTSSLINNFELYQNYPNPFNPISNIRFALPKTSQVKIDVYNILGQKVIELLNEQKKVGNHNVQFDGSNLSSGVYFYKIKAGSFVQVKKMLLIR